MSETIDQNPAGPLAEHCPADEVAPLGGPKTVNLRRRVRSLVFAPLKLVWRLLRPLRRPLVARFDFRIVQLLGDQFQGLSTQMNRLSVQVAQAHDQHLATTRDMNVFVEGLVREIARLQAQLQALSQTYAQVLSAQSQPAPWYAAETNELTTSH
jgi:hypothetical protein